MSGEPLVSILLPVHDAGVGAADAVRRLSGQTFGDFELVVVDDGSTDGSEDGLHKAVAADDRARLVTLPRNLGVAGARNRALAEARGGFVWFVDWDDDWSDRFLERMCRARDEHDADIVVCGATRHSAPGGPHRPIEGGRAHLDDSGGYLTALLRGDVHGFLWNKLFRHSLFDSDHFPPLPAQEDMAGQLILAGRVSRFARVEAVLYRHLERPGSLTNSTPKLENLVACLQIADAVRPAVPAWRSRRAQRLYDWFLVWFGLLDATNTALRMGADDELSRAVVAGLRRRVGPAALVAAVRFSPVRALQAAAIRGCQPCYRRAYAAGRAVRAAVRRLGSGPAASR